MSISPATVVADPDRPALRWDPAAIRDDFPMLRRSVRGHRLVYLDNAATALKPQPVIDAVVDYYTNVTANVARGVHTTSQQATERYESVREKVAAFLNVPATEIVFTAGTTASLNLVAATYGRSSLSPGDQVLVSELEHHSNLVPWHLVARETGARVRAIPMTEQGDLDLDWLAANLTAQTKIVALCHASNVLGTLIPLEEVARLAHRAGAVVVVDGAQAVPHLPVDLQRLGCDFYAFSAHKLFGPTGLGVLHGRQALLEAMGPWQGGGGMISSVEIDRSSYATSPTRFEAGTPAIAEVFGLGAVLEYLEGWNRSAALDHENGLAQYAIEQLSAIRGVRVFGGGAHRVGVVAFVLEGVHAHDVGTALDAGGVAVRAGHHCAQPLMRRLAVDATVRASFAPYNTKADVDALVAGVERAKSLFGR
jgi:cysteine desulfurase/selenocysteine lyase